MDYSPFNPFVWAIFAGCVALVYLTVQVYHRRYPHYPYESKRSEEQTNVVPRAAIRRISGLTLGDTSTEAEE